MPDDPFSISGGDHHVSCCHGGWWLVGGGPRRSAPHENHEKTKQQLSGFGC